MRELIEAVRKKNLLLFVGAGVSRNLGLPDWKKLIGHLAEKLQYDPLVFETFGDYMVLAEYYKLQQGGDMGPLRSWMDRTWHEHRDVGSSAVHKLIVELGAPLIYTTNYDRWLELAFEHYKKDYVRIRRGSDLVDVRPDVTQIIKFHGDFDDDESLVLTESDFFRRLDFESPLDIKLRADMLGRVALFIGYGLNDLNIRYMLYRLQRIWEGSKTKEVRPNSFIFLTRPNAVQEAVLKPRCVHAIHSEESDAGEGLKKFLTQLIADARGP